MSADVEELTRLVEEEKMAEDRIKQARSTAEEVIKKAREEAGSVIVEAQSSVSSTEPQAYRHREFEEEKLKIEQDHQQKIISLKKLAEKNLDRAVKMIIEDVMKVGS